MCFDALRSWILASVLVILVAALLESNARAKYATKLNCRSFWHTRYVYPLVLYWLLGLGRWKIKCPDCDNLGLCNHPNPKYPHSCDGQCRHVWVARSLLPADFNGCERAAGENAPEACVEAGVPVGTALGLTGCGWIEGSFWQMLRHGRWRGRKA